MRYLLVLLASFVVALLPQTGLAQTLLFKSGFENNTVLGAQQVQSTDSWQYFSGTDTSTGFTWPMSFWPASSAATGIHLIHYAVPGGMTAQQLMNNTIVSMTGHTGATTNVLQMEIDNWNAANGCCAQDWLQVSGLSQSTPLRSYYLREWVQLYPNAQSQMNANLGNWFHSMWAIKTSDDFRIEAYLYGHNSNTGMFHVQADCNTGSSWCGSTGGGNSQGQYWSYDNTSVAIPFGQWFLMEIYLNRGTPTDGSAARFYWAVNGHTVFDIRGTSSCPATGLGLPTCFFGKTNQETNLAILGGLYGDSALNQTPFGEWIDDIEIWNQPPCATLPCGSGSPAQPVISYFTASPTTINAGGSSTLSWATSGATSLSIDQGVGVVTGTSKPVSPSATTRYTLTASNGAGSVSASTTVTVGTLPSITSFTASPATVTPGNPNTLSWSVSGATSLFINQGIGTVTGTSVVVNPTGTITYVLTATNAVGSVTKSLTLWQRPVISSFASSPSSITSGSTSSLNWVTSGATSLSIDQGVGTVSGSSSVPVSPTVTTVYTLSATNPGGTTTATATVTVAASVPAIASFSVNPTVLLSGNAAILSWSVTGATSLSIDNGVGTVTGSSISVSPTVNTTYHLTATNGTGSSSAAVTVMVIPAVCH